MAIERYAVGALLLTGEPSILLMKFRLPRPKGFVWLTPGGGMKKEETALECLRRELREETGLETFVPGPLVWRRIHAFKLHGKWYRQHEDFYLISVAEFSPQTKNLEPGVELENFVELRWWKLAEIKESREIFVPGNLYGHLSELISGKVVDYPIEVGI